MGYFLIVLGIVAFVAIALYNRLIVLRNRVDAAWAQIDVQLKKRNDLVPNLVETVKGYVAHERGTLETITKARAQMASAGTVKEQAEASDALSGALKSLFAVAEAYPDLKANQNFLMLQEELSGIESKIAYARQFYNDSVLEFNASIESFPANLLAGAMSYRPKEYFHTPEAEKAVPKVSF
jgi:LemA protein